MQRKQGGKIGGQERKGEGRGRKKRA